MTKDFGLFVLLFYPGKVNNRSIKVNVWGIWGTPEAINQMAFVTMFYCFKSSKKQTGKNAPVLVKNHTAQPKKYEHKQQTLSHVLHLLVLKARHHGEHFS